MKNLHSVGLVRKIGLMVGLLMMHSNIFCDLDKSMNQATTDLCFATIAAVRSALTIGLSSYVVDAILSKFDATKNMESRGTLATGVCSALYLLFLVSAEYQKKHDQLEDENELDDSEEDSSNV